MLISSMIEFLVMQILQIRNDTEGCPAHRKCLKGVSQHVKRRECTADVPSIAVA